MSITTAFDGIERLPPPPSDQPYLEHQVNQGNRQLDPSTETRFTNTMGIHTSCFQLLASWTSGMAFLREMKKGQSRALWTDGSCYRKALAELLEFETRIGHHRLKYARFHEQTPSNIRRNQEYWFAWLSMQWLYHGLQTLIHHPFLHLTRRRSLDAVTPVSFQQHSVDHVLLHSRWVLNFVNLSTDKQLSINDPFIGHVVAVTATAFFTFFKVKESDLQQQAQTGFDKCCKFIEGQTLEWPHLKYTVRELSPRKHFPR